jgi:hypothetical protein
LPHSEDTTSTYSKEEEKESMVNKMISFKTDTTNNKIENPRGYRLGTATGKTIFHWGLNQVLGCTNLTLAPTGSHFNTQVQVVLVK